MRPRGRVLAGAMRRRARRRTGRCRELNPRQPRRPWLFVGAAHHSQASAIRAADAVRVDRRAALQPVPCQAREPPLATSALRRVSTSPATQQPAARDPRAQRSRTQMHPNPRHAQLSRLFVGAAHHRPALATHHLAPTGWVAPRAALQHAPRQPTFASPSVATRPPAHKARHASPAPRRARMPHGPALGTRQMYLTTHMRGSAATAASTCHACYTGDEWPFAAHRKH